MLTESKTTALKYKRFIFKINIVLLSGHKTILFKRLHNIIYVLLSLIYFNIYEALSYYLITGFKGSN